LKRIFFSDCEGPISKNDNAFEVTAHFVPEGDKLFSVISRYDDVLADVVMRTGYNAGDTLKLILPFLKAFDVTDVQIQEFSEETLMLIASTKESLVHIGGLTEAFIISTSYEHYIRALCENVGFPFDHTYCTRLELDKFMISKSEKASLKEFAEEISEMPTMRIPSDASSIKDLNMKDQTNVKRLDEIFWKEISKMTIGEVLSKIVPVGGEQKAQAVRELAGKSKVPLSSVMYVGDSITDVEAFKLVRGNDGLTISFNGNEYAVENAEVSVLSENSLVTALIAEVFINRGKADALKLAETWNLEFPKQKFSNSPIFDSIRRLYPDALPKVQIVTEKNMQSLGQESSKFRKKVRGEAVGKLG
jgi:energy-converting hydrogenase A subunit R